MCRSRLLGVGLKVKGIMKRGATAKFMGPVDPSQKRITNFFTRNVNTVPTDRSLSEKARKRRKTSSLLKPRNAGDEDVAVVDLLDSDVDDVDYYGSYEYKVRDISSGSTSTSSSAPESSSSATGSGSLKSRIPVVIKEFDVDNEDVICEDKIGPSKTEENAPSKSDNVEEEGDVFESTQVTQAVNVEDDNDDEENVGVIRLRNFNSILESSQSSQESVTESYYSSADADASKISASQSTVEILTATKRKISVTSPSVKRKSDSDSSKSSSSKKTPVKTPKAKLSYFSPVRQLQLKSRSSSKTPKNTPTKSGGPSPFKSPARNLNFGSAMSSPLKALWAKQKADPYYLKYFLTILDSVVADPYNEHLLNEEDKQVVEKFRNLSQNGKSLFVRLAGRSWRWLRESAVNYKEIGDNLSPVFQELHKAGFLDEIKDAQIDLEDILDLIAHDRLPEMCKQQNIKVPGNAKSKEKCIEAILKTVQKQSTLMGSMEGILKKKALEEVGTVYKLSAMPRGLFSRIFILFQPPQYWEQESDQDKLQLLSILLKEVGKVEYPSYKVMKTQPIYQDRDAVIAFQDAWKMLSKVEGLAESKDWDGVALVAEEAMTKFRSLLQNERIVQADSQLPLFLRSYVAGTLLAKICWLGVEGFQKRRDYEMANKYLEFLLSQTVYLLNYHGRWYERLVLNSTHLKLSSDDVQKLIERALADHNVKDNHKHDLHARLGKLKDKDKKLKAKKKIAKKRRRRKRNDDDESSSDDGSEDEDDILEMDGDETSPSFKPRHVLPEVTIKGEKMHSLDREYGKSVFIGTHSDGRAASLSSVEQFAMRHYREQGYVDGAHAEGSLPATLYGLLFWWVIYNDQIPDAFHSPYQPFPLDLFSDDFFSRRKPLIEDMLKNLRSEWTIDDALDQMRMTWNDNLNKLSIVNWGVVDDFSRLEVLVRSMGLPLIAGICERLSTNYRYYHSGFPDLIVWNETKCRIVEVKGPGDKLSAKQRLWIDYLMDLNADVEVCHVQAVSNKRIRRS